MTQSFKTKLAAVALAAVTLAGGIAASTGEAAAKPKFLGPAIGLGIAGAAIGIAAASTWGHPAYGYGYYGYGGCRFVPRYNAFGAYVGSVKVCHGW
ncbi:hypothetical protein A33M_3711 [Rhodovulum sp. PH10]|uniref:hypothetical protein n=1 Tax=Rhodovulum sp. PH10 TaxID=1187851 RepID=UPI00027C1E7B|nr:hypothetical protein [Rhodovulum sp. PH10]EJW10970.1 hypothetical protein A33M_3711 [Rhodovulum sp. PH10]